jgi:hypothetical protein
MAKLGVRVSRGSAPQAWRSREQTTYCCCACCASWLCGCAGERCGAIAKSNFGMPAPAFRPRDGLQRSRLSWTNRWCREQGRWSCWATAAALLRRAQGAPGSARRGGGRAAPLAALPALAAGGRRRGQRLALPVRLATPQASGLEGVSLCPTRVPSPGHTSCAAYGCSSCALLCGVVAHRPCVLPLLLLPASHAPTGARCWASSPASRRDPLARLTGLCLHAGSHAAWARLGTEGFEVCLSNQNPYGPACRHLGTLAVFR